MRGYDDYNSKFSWELERELNAPLTEDEETEKAEFLYDELKNEREE